MTGIWIACYFMVGVPALMGYGSLLGMLDKRLGASLPDPPEVSIHHRIFSEDMGAVSIVLLIAGIIATVIIALLSLPSVSSPAVRMVSMEVIIIFALFQVSFALWFIPNIVRSWQIHDRAN